MTTAEQFFALSERAQKIQIAVPKAVSLMRSSDLSRLGGSPCHRDFTEHSDTSRRFSPTETRQWAIRCQS